jgi:putative flippase GtrA
VRAWFRQFTGREHGPLVQFVKYGISGVIATVVHVLVFYVMASLILPALNPGDVLATRLHLPVTTVGDAVRARNSMADNVMAFLLSNLTAYVLNVCWVFRRGRHPWVVEIAFFYLVSGFSILVGSGLMGLLIRVYGMTTSLAFGANVVCSLLINYVLRKYAVFKG